MHGPAVILTNSVDDPEAEMWFAEPVGYTALPLDALLPASGSPAADHLRATFAPFLASAPDELIRQQFITHFAGTQQLLHALREVGTVHCSIGLHRDDLDVAGAPDDRPLLSLFTVSWRDTAVAPRGVTAARAVADVAGRAGVEYLELPCGPATLSETLLTPPVDSGLSRVPLAQFHAHLPHPDCRRVVVLTLSTTAVHRREPYRAILQQIAETVSFENPLAQG